MNKSDFVNQTMLEMSQLNGTEFEYMCGPILNILFDERLDNKGHNLKNKPVKAAVDYQSADSLKAGQCGTDMDYFTNKNMEKPFHDITSAIYILPSCQHLILLTNQEATNAHRRIFKKKLSEKALHLKVELKDSKDIAKLIYDNIERPDFDDVWKYLPKTYTLKGMYPCENSIPPCTSNSIRRDSVVKKIINILKKENVVLIYGISGIGKTELSKQIANTISKEFDSVKWINGNEVDPDISNVNIFNYNGGFNLKTYLNVNHGFIVVDNLNQNIQEFVQQFIANNSHNSKCVITSLTDSPFVKSFRLDELTTQEAEALLAKYKTKPTPEQHDIIMKAVSGYVLAISLMGAYVDSGDFTWEQISEDVKNITVMEDPDRQVKIMNRIIGKIYPEQTNILDAICALGKPIVSSAFIHESFTVFKINDLKRHAILCPIGQYSYYVHQMIIDSIRNMSRGCVSLIDYVLNFEDKHNDDKPAAYYFFNKNNRDILDKIYLYATDDQRKILLYTMLQIDDSYSDANQYINKITSLEGKGSFTNYDILLAIEKVELELSKERHTRGYANFAIAKIDNLNQILNNVKDISMKATLLHHIGKLYMRAKKNEEALRIFEQILSLNKEAYLTKLQMARAFKNIKDIESAKVQIKEILNAPVSSIPLSAILSIYDLIGERSFEDLQDIYIYNRIDEFKVLMLLSVNVFADLAIKALSRNSSRLQFSFNKVYHEIYQALPETPDYGSDSEKNFNFAVIKLFEYKSFKDKQTVEADKIYKVALDYFFKSNIDNDFGRKRMMDLYIAADNNNEAIELAKQFENQKDSFMHQNLTKAYKGLGMFQEALDSINMAITCSPDTKWLAPFYNDKAEVLHCMGDNNCLDCLNKAIEYSNNKQKDVLADKLKSWKIEWLLNNG